MKIIYDACMYYQLHDGSLIDSWVDQIAYKYVDHGGGKLIDQCIPNSMFVVRVFHFNMHVSHKDHKLFFKGQRDERVWQDKEPMLIYGTQRLNLYNGGPNGGGRAELVDWFCVFHVISRIEIELLIS